MLEMLADPDDKCYVYALPSKTKLFDDAQREKARCEAEAAAWDDEKRREMMNATQKMQLWQQSQDDE